MTPSLEPEDEFTASRISGPRALSPQEMITAALAATEAFDAKYVRKMFLQRAGLTDDGQINKDTAGSCYPKITPTQLRQIVITANWVPFEHPGVMEGCKAFRAEISGRVGIVDLSDLPADTVVTLEDRKGLGKVSATVQGILGPEVSFTIAILGPSRETREMQLWTFHPGEPVQPSIVQAEGRDGMQVTIPKAVALGFNKAKIVK